MKELRWIEPAPRRAARVLVLMLCCFGCNSQSSAENAATGAPTAAQSAAPEEKRAAEFAKNAAPNTAKAATAESFDTFEAYWPVFYAAVQKNDKEQIASLTRFPFETRGDSDDDPVKKLTREQFLQRLDSMLDEDPGLLMNGKETQREHIARSKELTPRQYATGDTSARVGVFQFEAHDGRWWLTRAYVSEE